MLKLQVLQAWTTTARQVSTTLTCTVLRGASSSSPSLRAFAIPSLASYGTKSPDGSSDIPATASNPWKEWYRPNKRAQARQELYGDCWPRTQSVKEKGIEEGLEVDRERSRRHLRRMLGDQYDAVIEETKREAYERYKSKEWRRDIERTKKEIIAKDDRKRKQGVLLIELPETSRNAVQD